MKVIAQLARYFWSRGALSPAEAGYLLDNGFARPSDFPGFAPDEAADDTTPDEEPLADEGHAGDDWPEWEEPRARRGRSGARRPDREAELKALLGDVRRVFELRRDAFADVARLAGVSEPCPSWEETLRVVRKLDGGRLDAELADGFRTGRLSLARLWEALDPEPLHALVEREDRRGPAAQAFRVLLALRDADRLGRYGWILKPHEIQSVSNLLHAHRELLGSLRRLYDADGAAIHAALEHGSLPVPFWALVLLFNARRARREGNLPDLRHEFGPLSPPRESVWRQAWANAIPMDPPALTPFLVSCFGEEDRDDLPAGHCGRALFCPVTWRTPPGAFTEGT